MDSNPINSPEQTKQALKNEQLKQNQLMNQNNGESCHAGAAEKVDKRLDGPNRPSV